MSTQKSFYIISALRSDSSSLGHLRTFDSEKEATDHAKNVIGIRDREGKPRMPFYILKVIAEVAPASSPVKVTRFRK